MTSDPTSASQPPTKPTVIAAHRARRDRRREGGMAPPGGATLETLLEHLGPSLLDVIAAPAGLSVPIRAPLIFDASAPPAIHEGDILLAVGLPPTGSRFLALIDAAARSGAVAVAVKRRQNLDLLAESADRAGIAALVIPEELSWDEVHGLIRAVIATTSDRPSAAGVALGDGPANDLFTLANAAASNLGGQVTIFNHRLQAVAFSSLDQPMDELARESILRRMPPDWFLEWLNSSGCMRRLLNSHAPVTFAPPAALPRRALAVRADGDVLGWLMVTGDDAPATDDAILAEVARAASHELVRLRGAHAIESRLRSEVFRGAMAGRGSLALLAARLDVDLDAPCWLLAVQPLSPCVAGKDDSQVRCQSVRDLMALRMETLDRRSVTVTSDGRVYALLPGAQARSGDVVRDLARQVVAHASRTLHVAVRVVYGQLDGGLAGLPAARADADRTLRRTIDRDQGQVVSWDEFSAEAILLELQELAAQRPRLVRGPIADLAESDCLRDGSQLETLRTFLDCGCDFTAASARLHVHRNTLRYRIQRITEATGLDLSDPTQRLVAELQLRLIEAPQLTDGAQAAPTRRSIGVKSNP